jgi:hypothetical protein
MSGSINNEKLESLDLNLKIELQKQELEELNLKIELKKQELEELNFKIELQKQESLDLDTKIELQKLELQILKLEILGFEELPTNKIVPSIDTYESPEDRLERMLEELNINASSELNRKDKIAYVGNGNNSERIEINYLPHVFSSKSEVSFTTKCDMNVCGSLNISPDWKLSFTNKDGEVTLESVEDVSNFNVDENDPLTILVHGRIKKELEEFSEIWGKNYLSDIELFRLLGSRPDIANTNSIIMIGKASHSADKATMITALNTDSVSELDTKDIISDSITSPTSIATIVTNTLAINEATKAPFSNNEICFKQFRKGGCRFSDCKYEHPDFSQKKFRSSKVVVGRNGNPVEIQFLLTLCCICENKVNMICSCAKNKNLIYTSDASSNELKELPFLELPTDTKTVFETTTNNKVIRTDKCNKCNCDVPKGGFTAHNKICSRRKITMTTMTTVTTVKMN